MLIIVNLNVLLFNQKYLCLNLNILINVCLLYETKYTNCIITLIASYIGTKIMVAKIVKIYTINPNSVDTNILI